MTMQTAQTDFTPRERDTATMKHLSEQRTVVDLISVLRPHRRGLRRWSVMRALRTRREAAGRSIPLKFEDDVERAFRKLCAGAEAFKSGNHGAEEPLFYRPQERAGEVWAVHIDRAEAWLDDKGERIG